MNWEALSAISTALTAVVILLTVVYAARQVRAMNEQSRALGAQLEHLRRATQLDGTLAIFEELFSPDLLTAYAFVMNEYAERMKDPDFRAATFGRAPDPQEHKYIIILRHMERIGTLIKNDLLDGTVIFDFADNFILGNWRELKPLVMEQRRAFDNERLWENFEYMATEAERFAARRDAGQSPGAS